MPYLSYQYSLRFLGAHLFLCYSCSAIKMSEILALITHFEHLKIQLEPIKSATNNFADENCIGKGGFGKVYKGELLHHKGQSIVAIKRLDRRFGQGNPEFWNEIIMLYQYKHKNIVSLLGFCDESNEKILVYEYASNGSLDLSLNSDNLTWIQRLKICIGAARGLAYLHNPVLHRDIKSSNILLDENWNAKISDLGLSKLGPANQHITFLVSDPVGTIGYWDPLYIETGYLTKESDVYSFGVMLFEILCGRLSLYSKNDKRRPLTGLVKEYYKKNKINELIYTNIQDEVNAKSLTAFTTIAHQCLNTNCEKRPLMTEVVSMLENALVYQANAQCSKVMDGEENTIIVDSSHLKALTLPDRKASNKVMQLIYTNSGSGLIVLSSSGLVKQWRWQKQSTASIVPQLWYPISGVLMANHLNENTPAEESVACIALTKNDCYVLSASGGNISLFDMMTSKVSKSIDKFTLLFNSEISI
uniref:Putative concanavalin A-like lectin/glucanase domain-containing protein n=1 Tax=Helianthus annuus TaxID=4232 RepID=A0A251SU26_HELAN